MEDDALPPPLWDYQALDNRQGPCLPAGSWRCIGIAEASSFTVG